jgi:protein-S-isoprenylcysteine O-methyltransferase Ste14
MTQTQAAVRLILLTAIFPTSIFPFAGRWDWKLAWMVVAAMVIATLSSRLLAFKVHPDLLHERANSMRADNVKPWDKILAPAMAVTPLLILMVAGLDERFHWSPPFGIGLQLTGLVLVVAGNTLGTWAMLVNPFFSAVVRIQTDRGHHVVESGPYAIVRHPGYAGNLLASLGIPMALSSIWAFGPVVLVLIVTALRTSLEDRTLKDELPGYTDFSAKTRFRLVPGIW